MFVYNVIAPQTETYISGGCTATVDGHYKASGTIDADSGSVATFGDIFIGESSTPVSVDCGSSTTVYSNRKFSSVSSDCGSSVTIRWIPITGIRIYEDGALQTTTSQVEFPGAVLDVTDDIKTITTDESMKYASRVDSVSSILMYKADATVGSVESDAVWRISRLTFAPDGDVTVEWADGDTDFDNIWDNRTTLSYS